MKRTLASVTAMIATLAVAGTLSGPANAISIDFETDGNGNALIAGDGTDIDDEFAAYGLTVSARRKNNPDRLHDRPLRIFNTNCGPDFGTSCTGGDSDLATGPSFGIEPQGNALIINNNNGNTPNDFAGGGIIAFEFDEAVTFESIGLLDLDFNENGDNDVTISAYQLNDDGTTTIVTQSLYGQDGDFGTFDDDGTLLNDPEVYDYEDEGGENSLFEFAFNLTSVTRVDVLFPSSGAVANLQFEPEGITSGGSADVPEPASAIALLAVGTLGVVSRLRRRR